MQGVHESSRAVSKTDETLGKRPSRFLWQLVLFPSASGRTARGGLLIVGAGFMVSVWGCIHVPSLISKPPADSHHPVPANYRFSIAVSLSPCTIGNGVATERYTQNRIHNERLDTLWRGSMFVGNSKHVRLTFLFGYSVRDRTAGRPKMRSSNYYRYLYRCRARPIYYSRNYTKKRSAIAPRLRVTQNIDARENDGRVWQ